MATTNRSAARPSIPNDVFFVYIGWADRYNGLEAIQGSHGYLAYGAADCSEMNAFVRGPNGYECGVGTGEVRAPRADVVFVAKPPSSSRHHVVGVYRDATFDLWPYSKNNTNKWHGAWTNRAVLLPTAARFAVSSWPGSSGLRRWARRDGLTLNAPLMRAYHRALKAGLPPAKVPPSDDPDEELSAFEGAESNAFVKHRKRERKLRIAKLSQVLRENDGHLACEVPGCGFDFVRTYGALGFAFAHVHHLKPLRDAPSSGAPRKLSDLAIVCANCHAMIHRYGACRPLREVKIHRSRKR